MGTMVLSFSNGLKPKEGRFRLNSGKKFFTTRGVNHNSLAREVVDASPLELFETRLDGALNLVSLPMARGLELDDLKVLSNPNNSMIPYSMIP